MYIAFDRGYQNAACRMTRGGTLFDVGGQDRDGTFHHAGTLDHLWQEHLALAKELPDLLHGGHQQAVDHRNRALQLLVCLQCIGLDVVGDAFEHGVAQTLLEGLVAPLFGGRSKGCSLRVGLQLLGILRETLGGIGSATENHILHTREQLGRNLIVDAQQGRIDNAHLHAGRNGVVEEGRVHRLAHRVVASEGKREVRDAARDLHMGTLLANRACGVDEGFSIAVVFGNTGGNGQDIGVEDDRLGREPIFGEEFVGSLGNLDFALVGVGLSPLVKEHHDGRCTIATDLAGLLQEMRFALLERDRIDHGTPLHHLQTGLDDLPA